MNKQTDACKIMIESLPRKTGLYPHVIRVLSHKNKYPLPKKRRIPDTQICIQLSETVSPFDVRIGGKKYSAPCPRVFIKRAGEIHQITRTDNVLSSFYFVYNAESNIEKQIPENLVLFPLEITPRIHSLMDSTLELLPHIGDFGICDRIDELCYSILHEIILGSCGNAQKISLQEKQIRRAVSWLHSHMLDQVDGVRLAGQFGVSQRSFTRHWRAYMKESPHQYLISLRMEEAKRLLAETGLRVGEIAGKIGYSSLESFGFAFRNRFGISPHAFRRQLR